MVASVEVGQGHVTLSLQDRQFLIASRNVQASIGRTARQLGLQGVAVQRTNGLVDRLNTSLQSSLIATAAYATGVGLVNRSLFSSVDAFIEFDRGLVQVAKTTGLTQDELNQLENEFTRLLTSSSRIGQALPVSSRELLDIATAAGQAGVSQVRALTDIAENAAALTVSSDLAAEQATLTLARLRRLTNSTADAYTNFASAITGLGNDIEATESQISSFATTLAASVAGFGGLDNAGLLGFAGFGARLQLEESTFASVLQRLIRGLQETASQAPEILQEIGIAAGRTREEIDQLRDALLAGDLERFNRQGLVILTEALSRAPVATDTSQRTRRELISSLGLEDNVRVDTVAGTLAANPDTLRETLEISERAYASGREQFDELLRSAGSYSAILQAISNILEDQQRRFGGGLLSILLGDDYNTVVTRFKALELLVASTLIGIGTQFGVFRIRAGLRQGQGLLTASLVDTERRGVATSEIRRESGRLQGALRAEQANLERQLRAHNVNLQNIRRQRNLALAGGAGPGGSQLDTQRAAILRADQRLLRQEQAAATARAASAGAQSRLRRQIATNTQQLAAAERELLIARRGVASQNLALATSATAYNRAIAVGAIRARAFGRTLLFLQGTAQLASRAFFALGGFFTLAIGALLLASNAVTNYRLRMEEARRSVDDMIESNDAFIESFQDQDSGLNEVGLRVRNSTRTVQDAVQRLREALEEQQRFERAQPAGLGLVLGFAAGLNRLANAEREVEAAAAAVQEAQENLARLRTELNLTGEDFEAAFGEGVVQFQEFTTFVDEAGRAVEDLALRLSRANVEQLRRAQLSRDLIGQSPVEIQAATAAFEEQLQIDRDRLQVQTELLRARTDLASQQETLRRNEAQLPGQPGGVRATSDDAEEVQRTVAAGREEVANTQTLIAALERRRDLLSELLPNYELLLEIARQERDVIIETALHERATFEARASFEARNATGDRLEVLREQVREQQREVEIRNQLAGLNASDQAAFRGRQQVLDEYGTALADLGRQATSLTAQLTELQGELDEAVAADDSEAVTRLTSEMDRLEQALTDVVVEAQGLAAAAPEFAELAARLGRLLGDLENETGRFHLATDLATSGIRLIEDAIVDLGTTGQGSLRSFFNALYADLLRIIVRATIVASLLRAIGLTPQGGVIEGGFIEGVQGRFFPQAHGGGVIGHSNLQRHSGLFRSNEQLAVLERGEEVITRRDPRHRWNIFGTPYADLRNYVARLPRFHQGGVVGGAGAVGAGGAMRVEIVNQTRQPIEVDSANQYVSGEGIVTQVIIRDLASNGRISQALDRKRALG